MSAGIKGGVASLICATCGADMVCIEHGLRLPCDMCVIEGVNPSMICGRCGRSESQEVKEIGQMKMPEKELNPQAANPLREKAKVNVDGKGGVTSLACAACGADMVCSEHGLSLPCDMCVAEGVESSLMCNRCGGTVSRKVSEAERLEMLDKVANPQTAKFNTLLRQAETGDVAAQYAVALMYRNGDGVAASEVVAIRWFRTAAEGGQVDAQLVLAQAYLHGEGVRKNTPEAVKWYKKAATKLPVAQYQLGMLFYEEYGSVKQDLNEANDWMTRAAESGFADAQYQLGLHSVGETAKSWLQKAAAQGHKEASESLTKILIDEGNDPLYEDAVDLVLKSQSASISLVQRELRIGYNRAAKLIDQMELAGIVSAVRSDGARDVLFTPDGKPVEIKRSKGVFALRVRDKITLVSIAGMLLHFMGVVTKHFAGYPPTIKKIAAGLILTAGVLWFFAGMVNDHFAKHQSTTISGQQVDAKQEPPQDTVPQPDITHAAVGDTPAEQEQIQDVIPPSDIASSDAAVDIPAAQGPYQGNLQPGQPVAGEASPGISNSGIGNNDGAAVLAPIGWVGIAVQTLAPEFIHSMGLAFGQGVLISDILDNGPAAQAGMAVGDILISIDGKKVGAENVVKVISGLPIGKTVTVEIIRNDARKHLLVKVEQKP